MSLHDVSTEDLHAARIELDHQIAALRDRKLEIAREIEARYPETGPQEQPAAPPEPQTVDAGFVESESGAFSPADPEPEPPPNTPTAAPRRRWFGRD